MTQDNIQVDTPQESSNEETYTTFSLFSYEKLIAFVNLEVQ